MSTRYHTTRRQAAMVPTSCALEAGAAADISHSNCLPLEPLGLNDVSAPPVQEEGPTPVTALSYTIRHNADTNAYSLYLPNPYDTDEIEWHGDYFSYHRAEDAAHTLIYQWLQRGLLAVDAPGNPGPLLAA